MHSNILLRPLLAVFLIACIAYAHAADLETKLTASRVTGSGTAEQFSDAATASPGEIIRYEAKFTNTTTRTLGKVMATLPIPPQLELILASVKPAAVEGSVDGKTFAPLARLLKPQSEGGQGVTPAAIRALRWAPRDLPASESFSVEARARLSSAAIKP